MLKNEDTYRVECATAISEDSIVSLLDLYQPLIKGDGILLYLTLHAEARHQRTQTTHRHLARIMDIPLDVLERARFRLEQYNLMQTFSRSHERYTSYIYKLRSPLPTVDFLHTRSYMNTYISAVGKKDSDEVAARLGNVGISTEGYRNVTKPYINTTARRNIDEPVYQDVKPRYVFNKEDEAIEFDYEKFISLCSALVFPIQLRTDENMNLIGRMATVYGISPSHMVEIVGACSTIDGETFNTERFRYLCKKTKPDVTVTNDPYDLPPVSYLQSRQNGRQLARGELDILEYLSVTMKFSNAVVNVMIDYILKTSDNRLNRKFVESVASEWARDGVETKEQALREAAKKPSYTNPRRVNTGRVQALPAYKKEENKPLSDATNEDVAAFEKLLKEHQEKLEEE